MEEALGVPAPEPQRAPLGEINIRGKEKRTIRLAAKFPNQGQRRSKRPSVSIFEDNETASSPLPALVAQPRATPTRKPEEELQRSPANVGASALASVDLSFTLFLEELTQQPAMARRKIKRSVCCARRSGKEEEPLHHRQQRRKEKLHAGVEDFSSEKLEEQLRTLENRKAELLRELEEVEHLKKTIKERLARNEHRAAAQDALPGVEPLRRVGECPESTPRTTAREDPPPEHAPTLCVKKLRTRTKKKAYQESSAALGKKHFQCSECGKFYSTRFNLRRHKEIHGRTAGSGRDEPGDFK